MMKSFRLRNIFSFLVLAAFCSSCSVNKAEIDNSLKKYSDGKVTVYNMALDTQRFLPASTFKIVNSLIGLQTGKIVNDTMMIKWDGKVRIFPNGDTAKDWNKDMGMTEAFKVSSVPYYQEVARRIGKDTMQAWIDSIGYGNKNISGPVDSFWLKISTDEQLGLVKRLYFDQLPFRKSVHEMVRDVMLQEDNTAYKLSYKTGWGFDEQKNNIGWMVGWVEENNHVYFFVTFVKAAPGNVDMKTIRKNITTGILKQLGFFNGKK